MSNREIAKPARGEREDPLASTDPAIDPAIETTLELDEDGTIQLHDPSETGERASCSLEPDHQRLPDGAIGTDDSGEFVRGGNSTQAPSNERSSPLASAHDAQLIGGDEIDSERLLTALTEAIGERELEQQVADLRTALGLEAPTSVDVRLRTVQQEVTTLTAYTDAIGAFLDENGTAQQVLDELRDELSAVSRRADALETDVTAMAETLSTMQAQFDELRETIEDRESLDEDFEEVKRAVVSLTQQQEGVHRSVLDRLHKLETEVGATTSDLNALKSELEAGHEWRNTVSEAILEAQRE